jgi:hypothetical protein
MSRLEQYFYVYIAIGAAIASISLVINWNNAHRLSPASFLVAHGLWLLSIGAILVCALLEP